MTTGRLSVLMCTEGTYPFEGGGVSVWCNILCQSLTQVDYTLYTIMSSPNLISKFQIPPNVRRIIRIPLWGVQEPARWGVEEPIAALTAEATRRPVQFSRVRARKAETTGPVIEAQFVPLLRRFLQGIQNPAADVSPYGPIVYAMWRYFQSYDWETTWKSEPVWRVFVEEALRPYEERPYDFLESEIPSHLDLTNVLRWMYNFLMPLNAEAPRVDLVHASIASFAGLAGVIAKHEYGAPFLITEHGVSIRERYIAISAADFSFFAKRFLLNMSGLVSKLIYLYADVVSPVANFNRRWEERYGLTAPPKIETVYNGIDPSVFTPKPKPARTAKRPTAVAAARVFPLKDIKMMIRSAAVARESIPEVYYLVYGSLNADPPYVAECRRLIAELNLEQTFEFGGFHNKPAEIYTEGDISVLSSISEGFPFTVLESMACARPVVGTDVGGVKESLEGFGVVVPPRDHEAFGRGVVKLLREDELRLELGRKAREQIILRFKTEDMINNYWELYQRMAAAGRTGPLLQTGALLELVN